MIDIVSLDCADCVRGGLGLALHWHIIMRICSTAYAFMCHGIKMVLRRGISAQSLHWGCNKRDDRLRVRHLLPPPLGLVLPPLVMTMSGWTKKRDVNTVRRQQYFPIVNVGVTVERTERSKFITLHLKLLLDAFDAALQTLALVWQLGTEV